MDEVGLCNAALGLVGSSTITSLDDASTAAELCTRLYPICRDAVLEDREWTFAVERASIAADATAPAFGYERRFSLPSGCLQVLQATDGICSADVPWTREGAFILTDMAAPLLVRYRVRVEDLMLWSAGAIMALTYRLAAALAGPLTENRALQDDLLAQYRQLVQVAGAADGRQGTDEVRTYSSRLSAAR